MAQNGAHAGVVVPRGASEEEARRIIYEASPLCDQCDETILSLADARAVSIGAFWKLVHTGCELTTILSGNPRLMGRRMSSRAFRRFGA